MSAEIDLFAEARDAHLRDMRSDRAGQGKLARRWGRELLDLAGPDPDRAALEAAAETRFSRMAPARRAALVTFTLELKDAPPEPSAERHLDPTTIPPRRATRKEMAMARTNARTKPTAEQARRAREICLAALTENPDADAAAVRQKIEDEGIPLNPQAFNVRYWMPVKRELGLAAPARRSRKSRAKPDAAPAAVWPEGIHLTPRQDGMAEVKIERILPLPVALRLLAAVAEEMIREVA